MLILTQPLSHGLCVVIDHLVHKGKKVSKEALLAAVAAAAGARLPPSPLPGSMLLAISMRWSTCVGFTLSAGSMLAMRRPLLYPPLASPPVWLIADIRLLLSVKLSGSKVRQRLLVFFDVD